MFKQITLILALTALTLTAWAQGPLTSGGKTINTKLVNLGCKMSQSGEWRTITITNTDSATIPAGTEVHWSVNSEMQGSLHLKNALAPGQSTSFEKEPGGHRSNPKAYYYKK